MEKIVTGVYQLSRVTNPHD